MTNKDITKIYFRGNEIVALYQGSTLIFKKSGVVPPKPTGVYKIKGTVTESSGNTQFNLFYNNGQRVNVKVNEDLTFETELQEPLTNANAMFRGRSYLETLDLNGLDTSQVTDMADMFSQSNYLKDIKLNIDTSNVNNMTRMFYNCYALTSLDLSNFDTSKVTSMEAMFNGCESLTSIDVSNFDTSKVTNMSSMFSYCKGLTSLDVSNFDTSNVTDMGYMFDQCTSLTSIDLSGSETTKLTSIGSMFSECYKLKDLYINFDLKLISEYQRDIFLSCRSLTNVVGKFNNFKQYLDLSFSPLTAASAMVFINGLATVTEQRTLSLSATTYDSLTPEQIAIATSKGWTVTRN